mgnify:CR=1 FL=1
MTIKQQIALIALCSVLCTAALAGFGWRSMSQMAGRVDNLATRNFLGLLDGEIVPLLNDEVLPLINGDVPRLESLQESITLMLEADRDMHQAVIAEKMMLVASESEDFAG